MAKNYEFSPDERILIRHLMQDSVNSIHRSETYHTINDFDNITLLELVDQLGAVDNWKEEGAGGVFSNFAYRGEGKKLWENSRKQILDAICGTSDNYKEERSKLREQTNNALIILIPLIMSALNIPPQFAGVAIVLSLMVLKIGLKTLCATSGQIEKLHGKPNEICQTTGKYSNVSIGKLVEVYQGTRFPDAPAYSDWIFLESLPEK